jgi:hypothetical protein
MYDSSGSLGGLEPIQLVVVIVASEERVLGSVTGGSRWWRYSSGRLWRTRGCRFKSNPRCLRQQALFVLQTAIYILVQEYVHNGNPTKFPPGKVVRQADKGKHTFKKEIISSSSLILHMTVVRLTLQTRGNYISSSVAVAAECGVIEIKRWMVKCVDRRAVLMF